jgi:hypothetical protein
MYKSVCSRWLQLLGVATVVLYWLSEQNSFARFDLLFAYAQAVQRLSVLIILLDCMEGRNWQLKIALDSYILSYYLVSLGRLNCI